MKIFLSYNATRESAVWVRRLSDRLQEAMAAELGDKNAKYVYVDKSLKEGDLWPKHLVQELNACDVFLPLYSPLFFGSTYCRKELGFVVERIRRSGNAAALVSVPILPVLWYRLANRTSEGYSIPPRSGDPLLDELQLWPRDEVKRGKYSLSDVAREGLEYFLKQDGNPDFTPVIDEYMRHLAGQIRTLAQLRGVMSKVDIALENAPDPFAQQQAAVNAGGAMPVPARAGGSRVHFIVVAAKPEEIDGVPGIAANADAYRDEGGTDWRPFWPDSRYIGRCLQAIVIKNFDDAEAVPIAVDDVARASQLAAKAAKLGQPLFIIVDAWSSRLNKYADFVESLSRQNLPYCAVVVPFVSAMERNDVVEHMHTLLQAREAVDDPLFQTYVAINERELEKCIADLHEKIRAKFRKRVRSYDAREPARPPFQGGARPLVSGV